MKTLSILFLSLSVALAVTSCSSDEENFQPVTETPEPQAEIQIPIDPLANIGAVVKEGYPKMIKKYENGSLKYWAQYYYRPDGNILKVDYGYSNSTSEIFSNNYQYSANGNLVKMVGWDVFDYHWNNGRIIKVEAYNGAWYGRYDMFYEYNDQGQIIQKLVVYYGTTPVSYQKFQYTYFTDGNLKSIEEYGDYNQGGTFKLYTKTDFANHIEPRNMFMDLEIIPGQSELFHFPGTKAFKHFESSGYDHFETYEYNYDANGRVIEQRYGNNKIVYEYY